MAQFTFNPKQLVVDVVKVGIAFAIAASGHPYVAILVAAVHITARV